SEHRHVGQHQLPDPNRYFGFDKLAEQLKWPDIVEWIERIYKEHPEAEHDRERLRELLSDAAVVRFPRRMEDAEHNLRGEVVGGGVEAQHARGNTEEEDGGIGRDGDRARIQS